jgi:hypothetical protein
MDQVRTALNWLKRQHFWVLSVLTALIMLVCWYSASNKLSALYATSEKTITTEFGNLKTVKDAAFHPNQSINQRQEEETKKQIDSVAKLWQQLYDRQSKTVLQWPASLSEKFRTTVEKLEFGQDIPDQQRTNYQNYIRQHFPELPKQINAREIAAGIGGGPGGAGEFRGQMAYQPQVPNADGTMPDDNDYICEWLDQNIIRDELDFPDQPSSLRIWVTQEDLWVYHTLLDVIAKTNAAANSTRNTNAAVKTVIALEVGQRAGVNSRQPNRILVRPAAPAGAGPGGPEGAPGGPGAGREGGAMSGGRPMGPMGPGAERGMSFGSMQPGAVMSPADEQNFLLSYRYLDDKGQPISVGAPAAGAAGPEGGTPPDPAAAAGPAPPLDVSLFGTGYKRLPVRMVLYMDSRWLPQLITACANEPLRIEVQEVRINPADGGGVGGMTGGPSGFGGPSGSMTGANLFPDHTGIQSFPAQPSVATVVVQGTIYIFNKPNVNQLQQPAAAPTGGAVAAQ